MPKLRRFFSTLLIVMVFGVIAPLFADNASYTPDPEITARIASDPSIIKSKLISSMNKILENPATLTIELTPVDDEHTARGRFKKIEVFTSRGSIDNLTLNRADIDFEDVQLDTRKLLEEEKIDPVSMSNIDMDVSILESDLNAFLESKSKSIKVDRPRIELTPGNMALSGSTKYGLVKVEFWASGHLSIKSGKEIWFHAGKMKVNRMTMPRSFVGMIIKKINPVLDLEKFPFRLNLEAIELKKGEMHFISFRTGENTATK